MWSKDKIINLKQSAINISRLSQSLLGTTWMCHVKCVLVYTLGLTSKSVLSVNTTIFALSPWILLQRGSNLRELKCGGRIVNYIHNLTVADEQLAADGNFRSLQSSAAVIQFPKNIIGWPFEKQIRPPSIVPFQSYWHSNELRAVITKSTVAWRASISAQWKGGQPLCQSALVAVPAVRNLLMLDNKKLTFKWA